MKIITTSPSHNSGVPLGGIGTGTVEVHPDGYFHQWQIFNLGQWAPQQPDCCPVEAPDMGPGALAFHVWAKSPKNAPIMRRLGMRTDQHDMYSFTWLKSVQEIEYEGRFPAAKLNYRDDDLPVAVTARMFSPIVPHDSRTSGTPGFYVVFTVKNLTDQPVDVSLLGTLKNPLAWGAADRKLHNTVSAENGATLLTMRTGLGGAGILPACGEGVSPSCVAGLPPASGVSPLTQKKKQQQQDADKMSATHEGKMPSPRYPTIGSIGMSVSGGQASWIAGEFSHIMQGVFHWDYVFGSCSCESFLHEFRATGRLPNVNAGESPATLLRITPEEIDALGEAEIKRLVREIRKYGFAQSVWQRVSVADKSALAGKKGLATFLKAIRARLDQYAGRDRKGRQWGDGALASSIQLAPAEEKEICFTLGWHFPFHFSKRGQVLGHMYENWFKDAQDVNRFLVSQRADLAPRVCEFADALFDTTLDGELADAWSGQLTTLNKCTWWTKDGQFAVWEGLGCCGFHTTDITYQGSFNILALFPDLQKRQMELGAKFQRADGRVHHFFTPDLSAVDEGFDRVDMNPQYVLLVTRDYLWTGDKAYLTRMWPHILRAMDNSEQLDADGDGLPDHDTKRNTYDAWNFFGTPSYIASLWLSALLAAARVAGDLGHKAQERKWRAILKKGAAAFERKLWNGEYYSLWADGKLRDECCMTDQIDGEWFTQLIGLGHVLPRQRVVAALKAVMKHNFSPEAGLLNATYPPGTKPRLSTFHNVQADAPWTGIEYAIASMMFDFGMPAEAQAVTKNIHERYLRAGRFWNHVECGDHYYRAMSSWAILLGATGFKIDVPRKTVTFAPAVRSETVKAPWVSATGWGRFERSVTCFKLSCNSGALAFRTLRLGFASKVVTVALNGATVRQKTRRGELTEIEFAKEISIKPGDNLIVDII